MNKIIPPTVDLQINGYAGIDFNADELTETELLVAFEQLKQDGNRAVFPTLITASDEQLLGRLQRLVDFRNSHPEFHSLIAGWHFEGPFLSAVPGYIGAHPKQFARIAERRLLDQLLNASSSLPVIVTLAPEQDPQGNITRWLSDQKVIVAAGHTDCSTTELKCCIDQGLRMFTHLGNGCPLNMHRHDNIINRVLSLSDQLKISVICDGWHVPWNVLQLWKQIIPSENLIAVTDAISAAACGEGEFPLGQQSVTVGKDGVPRMSAGGQFAGSALTMPQCIENLSNMLQLEDHRICQWTSESAINLLSSFGHSL